MLNFTQQFEAPLPQKQKTFSGLFLAFLKCALNLENFEKKMSMLALLFPKLLTPKEVVRSTSKMCSFRTLFRSQRVNEFRTLLK